MSKGAWTDMLRARAWQNRGARVEQGPDGTVSVWVKRTRRLLPPLSWIVPFREESVTRLDRLGGRIWALCDGNHSVEDIVDAVAAQHRLTFHESRVAVVGYLKDLIQRGVLAIEMAEEEN